MIHGSDHRYREREVMRSQLAHREAEIRVLKATLKARDEFIELLFTPPDLSNPNHDCDPGDCTDSRR